jgi:hypothetical protein
MCCVPTFLFFYLFVECHNLLCCCLLMGNYLLCCAEIILFYLFVERESNLLCRVFIYFCLCPGRVFGLFVLGG